MTAAPMMRHAAHGRRAGLGEVALRAVLADLLADPLHPQPVDEQRRGEHGDQQGDAAGQEEVGHGCPRRDARIRASAVRAMLDVVEGQDPAGDLLTGLVALAGDQDHVAGLGRGQGRRRWPRPGPVRPPAFERSADAGDHLLDDGVGILGAGIVRGDDGQVGQSGRRPRP